MPKTNVRPLESYTDDTSLFYVMDLRTNEVFDIPFPPETLDEKPNTPSFESSSVIGRTSQFLTYTMSDNRSFDVTIKVIDDYVKMPLSEVRDFFASLAMPQYDAYKIVPSNVQAKLGGIIIRGPMTAIGFQWSGPWRNGYYTVLTITFTIKEARQIPLGASQVRAGGLNNV